MEVNFDPFPVLETERLILRRIIVEDATDYFEMRSNVDAMKYICQPIQKSVEETTEKIVRINEMVNMNDGIGWAVCLKTDNIMIGTVSFHKLFKEHYRAELGYMLNPKLWRQGITAEAVKCIIDFGFNQLHLHSIEAHIDPENKGSEKLLQRCNFLREAYFKENYYFNGKFLDTAVYSLISPL